MYTGTMIEDLINSVEHAERHAREEQDLKLEFHDRPSPRMELRELEVA